MKKYYILVLFWLIIAGVSTAETSPYKVNEAEIDLLFSEAAEINITNVYAAGMFNLSPLSRSAKTDDDKKIIAGVLALTFLGAFGVHRYYLGHVKAGVIGYLLPSICFGAGWIPAIVDGVLYLTSTDEEFNKKYRDNQKIWVWL